MASKDYLPTVTIVGGGMITQVQILPSIYQLQRLGLVGDIQISALNGAPLKVLAEDKLLKRAFPSQSFTPFPDFGKVDPEEKFPELFQEVLDSMAPRNIVIVAVPDQLHYPVIKAALAAGQHVITVKPLVLKHREAVEIEKIGHDNGLFVGVEYHKRFDDRNLMARQAFRDGLLGEFRLGQSRLHEPWYYRHSNFQNWMTCENSDSFSYIACHYIDLVAFITGLRPTAISVSAIVEKYPNGNEGFLYTDGRVTWENGAILNVQNSLSFPIDSPGGNSQGMMLMFKGSDTGALVSHEDQFRGVKHSYLSKGSDPGDTVYSEPNPDYFRMVPAGGGGLRPIGYGYRSVEALVQAVRHVEAGAAGLAGDESLAARRRLIEACDDEGLIATPANSAFNELVMEAGRKSILSHGREVVIEYGERAGVSFRKYERE